LNRFPSVSSATLIFLLLATLPGAVAQDAVSPDDAVDAQATADLIATSIGAVEARTDLDDETRATVVEQLRNAELQLQRKTVAESSAAAFTAALETAPGETEALLARVTEEAPPVPTSQRLGISDQAELGELEQMLAQAVAESAAVGRDLSELEEQIEAQEKRPSAGRDRIAELRDSRDELALQIAAEPPPGEPQVLTDARNLRAQLSRAAQAAEINQLEQEILSNTVRLDLLRAQREVAAVSRARAEQNAEFIRTLVNAKRQSSAVLAQQAAAVAEAAAVEKHPAVQNLAVGNASLTAQLPELAADIERVGGELNLLEQQVADIELRLARSIQRLEVGGVSRVMGRLLIEEYRNLPQVSQYRIAVRARSSTLAEIGLAQVGIQEQQRALSPLEASVNATMLEVAQDVDSEEERASIRNEILTLLRDRRDLLDQVNNTYRSYLRALSDLDVAQRRLLDSSSKYKDFLDQNLMWIPSAAIIGTGAWQEAGPALAWVLSPEQWSQTISIILDSLRGQLALAIFFGLVLVLLIAIRRPLAAAYQSMSKRVDNLSTDNIGLTIASLGIVALRALPLPLLLGGVGWLLQHSGVQTPFSKAVANGVMSLAPFLYNVLVFRLLCEDQGVARIHFGWREDSLIVFRKQLDRLTRIVAPLVFLTVLLYSSEVAGDRATLGRIVYVASMVILSIVIRPIVHPEDGVAAGFYGKSQTHWLTKFRWLWYGVCAGGPLLLALVSMLGYLYTASILTGLLVDTIWLALGIMVANVVILRWLALARRRLEWQRAIKEREAEEAEQQSDADQEPEGELPVVESKPLDLDAVDIQTRKLLQSGLFLIAVIAGWGIWSEVFPAFNLLQRVALWSQTIMVDGVSTIVPVTLSDLLLALVVAAVTVVASKNLPGLTEIVLLQHLDLQAGSRYTINTLLRYVVVTIGSFTVLNIVGWNWSQIQWLVAALSVGLGFGLQEIVANFVAGLIILFERPVRVGDTVTVGQLTGTVSRVRIRATTITDWDRKEIIVPNKSFITEQVVNWTLSDPITRIVIPVGISYGSDVGRAHEVMEDTLRSLPLVLDEPPPKAYFMGFGESSLDFKLYIYSRQLADRFPIMHGVHEAILAALREHDIEIPFPQRDLHLRSTVENKTE